MVAIKLIEKLNVSLILLSHSHILHTIFIHSRTVLRSFNPWRFSLSFLWPRFPSFDFMITCLTSLYGAFSQDVTAALLVFQNEATAAMLVYQTKPLGIELHFHANFFFCGMKLTWLLVTSVKMLDRPILVTQCCTQLKSFGNKTFHFKYFH